MAKTEYAQTRLMRQIPGVGAITSVAFTLTIEDPHPESAQMEILTRTVQFSPFRRSLGTRPRLYSERALQPYTINCYPIRHFLPASISHRSLLTSFVTLLWSFGEPR